MKKMLLLLLLLPGLVFAQFPRDLQIDVSYDAPPTSEGITNYLCTYTMKKDLVLGAPVNCDFVAVNPVAPHVITLLANEDDEISVTLTACNPNGCSGGTQVLNLILPLAFDNASAPTGVTVVAIKI